MVSLKEKYKKPYGERERESVVAQERTKYKATNLQPTAMLIQETKSFLNTSFLLVYEVQFSKNLHITRDYWKTNERILIHFALQGTTI